MQTIKDYLDKTTLHYMLVHVQGELRVYDETRHYYVSVKEIDANLPYLVSLVRLAHHNAEFELFAVVQSAVDSINQRDRRELDLCG